MVDAKKKGKHMKLDWSHWVYTLLKTVIGGVAGAGSAWLGTLVGSQIDSSIRTLDLRQLGFVLLSSTLLNLFFFLKQSPLPEDNDKTPSSTVKLPLILLTALLSFGAMATFTGCTTPPTKEAVVYNSFKDAWTIAHSAYQAHCENVVSGKVSKVKELEIDKAWNRFRLVFKTAFNAANHDWNKLPPATLDAAEKELLTLIRTL